MAGGDEKLLGTLKLSAGDVLSTIQKVNDAMKTLGQGVNLDLTKNLKASVENLLAPIKKQMDEIAKASTGHSAQQVSDQTKVTSLLKQQYQFQIEMVKATSQEERSYAESKLASVQRQLEYYQLEKQELVEQANTRKELITLQERQNKALVHAEGQYSKEQRKADLKEEHDLVKAQEQDVKELMAARDAANKAWEKSTMEAIEFNSRAVDTFLKKQEEAARQEESTKAAAAAAQKKQQDEIRDYNVKSLNDQMKARQDYVNWWVKALAEQEANQKKAFDSEVQSASKLYQEIKQLENQLGNTSVGPQQRGAIAAQLAEKQRAYEGYTKAVRDAAEKDKDVLALQQQISLETARQADAANAMMGNRIATKVGQFSLSLIKEQWNAAVEYASSYYDQLNEIRTITGKTEDEAAKMGDRLRKLAKDMSVTSTELATAAVTFYRQGLEDSQVNARLEWVTKYAKVAKVEFSSAAELVTAAMNSMSKDIDGDVQRVVDVFLYLGDAAATSGEEIGKAMQKASASATEFGLSFEWLGAYIATVSETTRQAPESIGNAFNSMLARLHNIKQNGFNEEDATKINDVAKALSNVDIALLDQEGNWRDMSDIFKDISEKWADMSDKQKSYIATTVAGTRQQNVFFALMNDMSKGIENGSRAWELYTGALNAAGTATEKYNIWEESVEAAQGRLKNSLEGLYSAMQPGIIKDFYSALSGLIDGIARLGPAPLIITALGSAIFVLGTNIHNLGGILLATQQAFSAHPLFSIATQAVGIITVLGTISGFVGEVETDADRYNKAVAKMDEARAVIDNLNTKQKDNIETFAELNRQTELTSSQQQELNTVMSNLSGISLNAKQAIDQFKDGQITATEATKKLNEALEQEIKNQQDLASYNAREALRNMDKSSLRAESVRVGRTTWDDSMDNLEKMFHMQDRFLSEGQLPTWSNWMDHQLNGDFVELYDEMDQQFMRFVKKVRENLEGAVNPDDAGKEIEGAIKAYENNLLKFREQVLERLNTAFENMILASGVELSPTAKGVLRQQMEDALLGGADDGEYNSYEWNKALDWFEKKRSELISKAMEASGDSDAALVGGESQLKTLVSKIIGEDSIAEMETLIETYANDSDFVDAINKAYTQMIEAGLSDVDIRKIFEDMAFENWGDISLSKILADKMGVADFSEVFSWENEIGEVEALSTEVMGLMNSLLNAGVSADELMAALDGTNSLEEYAAKQKSIQTTTTETAEETKETAKSFADAEKEIKRVDDLLKTIGAGKNPSLSDILELAKTHPEILEATKDLETLKNKLEEIKALEQKNLESGLADIIKQDSGLFDGNKVAQSYSNMFGKTYGASFENFQQLIDFVQSDSFIKSAGKDQSAKILEQLNNEVQQYVNNLLDATKETEEYAGALSGLKDVIADLTNVSSAQEALEILNNPDENGPEKVLQAIETLQKIFPELKDAGADEFIGEATTKTNELEQAAVQATEQFGALGQIILDSMKQGEEGLAEFAEKIAETLYHNQSSTDNYQGQVSSLTKAIDQGGIEAAVEIWNGFDETIQSAIGNKFPQLILALNDADKAAKEFGRGSQEANKALAAFQKTASDVTKNNAAKYFDNTVKAISGLQNGTVRVADGVAAMNKEIETAIKAQIEYDAVNKEFAAGNEVSASSVSNLSALLGGLDTQWILDNWSQIGPMMANALAEGEDAIQRFNEAAFIVITGITDVDFSQLLNGLIDVNSLAEDAVQRLAATGQWEVVTIETPQEAWIREGNKWIKKTLPAQAKVLKPTGNNPFGTGGSSYKPKTGSGSSGGKGRSGGGGGGGGGGGSSSSNAPSEVEVMLDQMEQIQKLYQYQQNMFQSEQNYYSQTGELQGVILYLQKEGEVLLGQNKILEENIAEIESWMTRKKAELDALSNSSEEYKEAADDLKALQERHQQYTKELIDNKTQIDKLNKAIKEQNNKIRDMEIDLRNTILDAIKDREALNERMLQGTITTENTILELIQKRYEKERDLILDNTQKQIDALKEERDLMSEQLQLRREQQEMEDKRAKLAELETQYARIMADPTRRNEALNIQDQIKDLRDEMAWETAENEIKAKQEDIDNQISSLEDYVTYVENWYNELFEHPQALIEEMQSIIVQADDDIITWLKENSEEFAEATEATQTSMINSWGEMLMDMHGQIKTYWDEVEKIIAGGDEAIIKFLAENSEAYREAGKLQAQAYVDQWKKQLSDLALAHKKVTETLVLNTYSVFNSIAGALSGKKSGGGSGGGSSSGTSGSSSSGADTGSAGTRKSISTYSFSNSTGNLGGYGDKAFNINNRVIQQYGVGGVATYPQVAVVGDSGRERILNPRQTDLFETLVASMERMARVNVPSLPTIGNDWANNIQGNVSVGDIILNVDKLESDDDYEEVADKVMELVMNRMNRGSAIGGIRY